MIIWNPEVYMKQFYAVIIAAVLLAAGCGSDHFRGEQGLSGASGIPGAAGESGYNSLVAIVSSASGCSNGGITVLSGLDSDRDANLSVNEVSASAEVCNGDDGQNGSNGSNGSNGQNGQNGQDAPPTAFTPVALINPCGDAPGVYDEVFIKLQNGTLIASFSENANGKNTRFSILTAGSYMTTDGDSCNFTLDATGNITSQSHYY